MILTIDNILTSEELTELTDILSQGNFVDGQTTAGWHAKLVKQNSQLDKTAPEVKSLEALVINALQRNLLFKLAIHPKHIHSLRFSRYEPKMHYGSHTDNALMGGQQFFRSDVSFTLFLSSPESYEGGELIIEKPEGDLSYKLNPGSIVLYPSTFLHRVETVKTGTRLVVVGWVHSLIRDTAQREILFDIDTVRRSIFAKDGKSVEFDLLAKTHANLLRQWAD
ncbi:unknown [Crocosphaera subtropica ATCC 51142]|uniref:PKHD-type hydroxylase cce_3668 n=1 Tax=Crocosphaera subtropica (strain ATCC 51142 / BH68) TaxID=43989 RepID=Y3668_CROS5|nr:Fe2+-dependent dioxygenase [Crocosphaera subtropica]B1X0X7.1 RecName: Full=PKHD-type hydroxylase cce_3668 [Crocosphaera subtropica ATCC 51142]ACB53016.1 unknown [Crocosphaera subtropica ATCC 51142]